MPTFNHPPAHRDAHAPLPWPWFDVEGPGEPVNARAADPVELDGWKRTWNVIIDSRPIPFKIFRRQPSPGKTRPTLLLMHGMGLTIATFQPISGYLFASHDLILVDYMSAAESTRDPDRDIGMKVYAQSIWRIADALRLPRLSLAGNSLGGGLCLIAALLQPDRTDCLLLANPACYPQILPSIYRLARIPLIGEFFMAITGADRFIDGVERVGFADKSRFDPILRRRYLENLGSIANRHRMMDIIRQLPAGPNDNTPAPHLARLRKLTCPVLLTWGAQDPLLAPGAGERLAQDLPNATFDLYPDLSHMPHEEDPARIGQRWAEFLNPSRTASPTGDPTHTAVDSRERPRAMEFA